MRLEEHIPYRTASLDLHSPAADNGSGACTAIRTMAILDEIPRNSLGKIDVDSY